MEIGTFGTSRKVSRAFVPHEWISTIRVAQNHVVDDERNTRVGRALEQLADKELPAAPR